MQLFINSVEGKRSINIKAATRNQLAKKVGGDWFIVGEDAYNIREVFAEESNNRIVSWAIIGGLAGVLAGPIGLIGGGILGGWYGNENRNCDSTKVRIFNNS